MNRTRQEAQRLGVLTALVIIALVAFVARLVHLQVFEADAYRAQVDKQSSTRVTIPAERGLFYDRRGELVAKNVFGYALYAYPSTRAQRDSIADYLDRFYSQRSGTALSEYKLEPRKFRYVRRRVSDAEAEKIAAEAPTGLFLRRDNQRMYPYGAVGKQVLGFTDIDNQGQSGLELAFDSLLSGQPGTADLQRDGNQRTYRIEEGALVKPVSGTSVVLTLDWRLQDILEKELRRCGDSFSASGVMGAFLDCRTGEILAIGHYDPAERDPEKPTKLRAIADQFEPGSVFKPFTATGVMEAGIVNYTEKVYCENGLWKVGRRLLRDDKKHEWLTFREIMEVSSNIGIAKWAIRADGAGVFDVYRRYGFGRKLKCGLPGEAAGRLTPPSVWSDFNIAQFSMGHSVAVTTLQLAAAFAAIANDGELLRPQVIYGHLNRDGRVQKTARREVLEQVVQKTSLDSLRAALRGVVEVGTAKLVNSPIVEIAGKTGTAQLPNLETGGYFQNRFTSSFAGFFPADSPVVAGAIIVVDPQPIHYGGYTAGPVFRRVAEQYVILHPDMFTLPAQLAQDSAKPQTDTVVTVPSLVGVELKEAQDIAKAWGVELHSSAAEGTVVWQFPPASRRVLSGDRVLVVSRNDSTGALAMPDLTGLPLPSVAAFLQFSGITYSIKGTGRVVAQSIRAGAVLNRDSICQVQCQPL